MDYDKNVEKDVASALDCLRQPCNALFVEFKGICLNNIERFREVSKGIQDKITNLDPKDTKAVWYLMDYLVAEMPMVFEEEFVTELPQMVAFMPWVAEKGRPDWGPHNCRALVTSWHGRGMFRGVTLDVLNRSIAKAVEAQSTDIAAAAAAVAAAATGAAKDEAA
eukprot:Rhum_TRINITY_DN14249_c31_g1::Rhum_TRINITY_DN14249_c31_g1_i1::g.77058::m.77058